MFKPIKYVFLLVFTTSVLVSFAQQDTLTQEVEVTKAYKPTISDANKLNSMPTIEETEHKKPTFRYNINSQPVFSTFSVNPLKAATIENAKQTRGKGYGLVRAGVGSYFKPYGEVFFNNLNSRSSMFGIHAMHLSSFGKIKLQGGDKIDAPFMKNTIELYVKHMFQKSLLSVNLDYNNNNFNYFGYPVNAVPKALLEPNQTVNYFGEKQVFNKGRFNIELSDPTAKIDEQAVGFNFNYHFFGTKTEQREHFANFTTNIRRPLQAGTGLLETGIQYTTANQITPRGDSVIGKTSQTWVFIHPAWYVGNKKANLRIGFNTWFVLGTEKKPKAKLTPNIRASWSPVPEIITLFAGIDGKYHSNHYSKIAYENPFVNPDHDIKNSFEKLRFYGGFDGKFAPKTNFKVSAEYSVVDDQNFYYLTESYYLNPNYNPAPLVANNTFSVLYDNMKRLTLNAEVFHASSDKLDLLASVNYYNYQLDNEREAWNMPEWDAKLSVGYKISKQLSVTTDLFLTGQRKALLIEYNQPSLSSGKQKLSIRKYKTLKPIIDLNLKGNYQISSRFSAFAQLNNLGFQKYQQWLGYPVQSFNFLAGISYSF